MNDPISALQAPPPRYLLESDSSDEEGQGEYAASSSRRSTKPAAPLEINFEWSNTQAQKPEELIIGLGQVGRYLSRKVGAGKEAKAAAAVRVLLGTSEVGRGYAVGHTLLLELEDAEGEVAWSLAERIIEEFKGANLTLITAYVPAMYIPDASAPSRAASEAPVRHLAASRSTADGIAKWDSPNYLTGIAGAFASLAAHPSSPLQATSLTTLVLPLPLSGLSTSTLASALSKTSPALAAVLAEKQKSAARETRWEEADDEPFSASGMGGGKKSAVKSGAASLGKEEISSMYM